jgi:DNA-binding transcriptional LysR family regulator
LSPDNQHKNPGDLAKEGHECLLLQFHDPATGRPFDWEFLRAVEVLMVKVHGRLVFNDGATALAACSAALYIAQSTARRGLGLDEALRIGRLIELFPDWNGERVPLYGYHLTCHLPSAKVRSFSDFLVGNVG